MFSIAINERSIIVIGINIIIFLCIKTGRSGRR